MRVNPKLTTTTLLVAGLALVAPEWPATAEPFAPVPPSQHVQQANILDHVAALAEKPGPLGPEARHLQTLLQTYTQYQEDVLLPPLTLLPRIAANDVGPDMKWALALVERARAEQGQTAEWHEQITGQLVVLFAAAQQADDAQAVMLAQDIAAWMDNQIAVTEPAVQLLGKYLRLRYASAS